MHARLRDMYGKHTNLASREVDWRYFCDWGNMLQVHTAMYDIRHFRSNATLISLQQQLDLSHASRLVINMQRKTRHRYSSLIVCLSVIINTFVGDPSALLCTASK